MGLNYRRYMDEETAKRVRAVYNRIYETGEPGQLKSEAIIRKNGTKCVFESNIQLMRDRDGKPIGFRGVHRDVTARHVPPPAP